MPISLDRARRAQDAVLEQLRVNGIQGAAGLTDRNGSWLVKVSLVAPLPSGASFPSEIDGVPVQLEVVGETRAL